MADLGEESEGVGVFTPTVGTCMEATTCLPQTAPAHHVSAQSLHSSSTVSVLYLHIVHLHSTVLSNLGIR
jgi:hypothetical protein